VVVVQEVLDSWSSLYFPVLVQLSYQLSPGLHQFNFGLLAQGLDDLFDNPALQQVVSDDVDLRPPVDLLDRLVFTLEYEVHEVGFVEFGAVHFHSFQD